MEQGCIFCKIVRGEIPGEKVYEDDRLLAFLDIAPVNPGHTLVVPKSHHATFAEVPPELAAHIARKIQVISEAAKKAVNADGHNISVSTGKAAGQVVFHCHFHIIPRFMNDGLHLFPHGKYKGTEISDVAEKIRNVLK